MKKRIKVVVFSTESCAYELPETPKDFLKWWQDKFDLAPPEYQEALQVVCSTSVYYDNTEFGVEIYYYRDETLDEEQARIAHNEQALKEREAEELQTLKRLADKYKKEIREYR